MSQLSSVFSRRLLIASVVLGLLVLFDIVLFGWLIFRSLSQREVDRVLLETREDAKGLAQRLAERAKDGNQDLYVIMALEVEAQDLIDANLQQGELIRAIEILSKDGSLVWAYERPLSDTPSEKSPRVPRIESEELPERSVDLEDLSYEVREEIGDLGWLQVAISPRELRQRTEVLRQDLIRQMVWILVVSLAVLVSAYVIIWLLLKRARRAEEQAAEADRMAYVGTLAAGLAHEIRNPLNSLNLNMQMLQEEIDDGSDLPSGRRLLGITRQEISRLEGLVTDFLLFARPRPLQLEEVEPGQLLERIKEVLAGEIRARGALIEVEDRSDGARVRVDPSQINQLLLNLTQNALAATENTDRRPRVTLSSARRGNRVVLTVADNGVGIPVHEQHRIFELFYSTRKGGTGLGLAVVERIARDHGAELGVTSEPGEGTSISLLLPLIEAPEPAADRRPALRAPRYSTTTAAKLPPLP